jgi:hypothetical protein
MQLNDLLTEAEIDALLEAPLDMPEGASLVTQLETLMHRLESAKRALGITNRLTNPEDRKRHRSRVMSFMNQLRAMFNRVADQMEADMAKEDQPNPEERGSVAPQAGAMPSDMRMAA